MLTIQELLRLQGSHGLQGGVRTTRAVIAIGKAVEREWGVVMRKKMGNVLPPAATDIEPRLIPINMNEESVERSEGNGNVQTSNGSYTPTPHFYYLPPTLSHLYTSRAHHRKLMEIDERWNYSSEWTQHNRARVGAFLVDALMKVAKIELKMEKKFGEYDPDRPEDYFQ